MCYFILSVTPQYLWTVQKISDSRIHGSNPIAAHGNVKAEDGGLQLNGVDAWLDAGDFYGQCLGDPDLCIKGFSFALQVQHLTLIPKFLQAFPFDFTAVTIYGLRNVTIGMVCRRGNV